ncbi:hypothetical protein [Persicitalea sp.]
MNSHTTKRSAAQNTKKPYVKPVLKTIGSVTELTLKAGSLADGLTTRSA